MLLDCEDFEQYVKKYFIDPSILRSRPPFKYKIHDPTSEHRNALLLPYLHITIINIGQLVLRIVIFSKIIHNNGNFSLRTAILYLSALKSVTLYCCYPASSWFLLRRGETNCSQGIVLSINQVYTYMNLNTRESSILKTDNDYFTHWPVSHKLAVQSKKADFSALKYIN